MITTPDAWICYTVQWLFAERWETPYVGACPASLYSAMPDANRNSLFASMITPSDVTRASPNSVHATEAEALAMRDAIIASMAVKPHFNVNGVELPPKRAGSRGTRVRDVNTGEIHASALQAARALGVSQSAVSKHLSGNIATLAGTRLERV